MPKGPFYYWSKNGTGPNALLESLKTHYRDLSAHYLQKGMKREASHFEKIAEEFEQIQDEMKELSNSQFSRNQQL